MLRLHPRFAESESLELSPYNLGFNKTSKKFWCVPKLDIIAEGETLRHLLTFETKGTGWMYWYLLNNLFKTPNEYYFHWYFLLTWYIYDTKRVHCWKDCINNTICFWLKIIFTELFSKYRRVHDHF